MVSGGRLLNFCRLYSNVHVLCIWNVGKKNGADGETGADLMALVVVLNALLDGVKDLV